MDEKVRILMTETGCSESEALIALAACDHNIDLCKTWLIENIEDIYIIKFNFHSNENQTFGCGFFILNLKEKNLIRQGILVTYKNDILNFSLKSFWDVFEKKIYKFRLWQGCIQDLTQKLEHKFLLEFSDVKNSLFEENKLENSQIEKSKKYLLDIISSELKLKGVLLNLVIEKLITKNYNIDKFLSIPSQKYLFKDLNAIVILKSEIILKKEKGVHIKYLNEGDIILAKITDTRDLGIYLAKILGARSLDDELKAIPVKCEKIESLEDNLKITLRYAPGVISIIEVKKDEYIDILVFSKNKFLRKLKSKLNNLTLKINPKKPK